jgi:phage baseplate assembly protein W
MSMVTYVGYSTIDSKNINSVLTDKDLALRDLLNHFYTRKGERVMNPNFGSILHDLIFEPLDATTEQLARDDVQNIIDSDPRWIFSELNLSKPTDHQLDIRVRVVYDDTGLAEELYLTYTSEIT